MLFGSEENPKRRPLIMAIVNMTPDSFSGDGLMAEDSDYIRTALAYASMQIGEGADLLDIGGESSRPGSEVISAEEEMRRVVPVIREIRQKFPIIPIAVDTVKSAVARAAMEAGATIINDISALSADNQMIDVVRETGADVVLMHNAANARNVTRHAKIGGEYQPAAYEDILEDVFSYLSERAAFAEKAGVPRGKIILDPGIGFGKTVEQNMRLSREVPRLKAAGYPILLGPSRKSFIGRVLDLPVEERLEGTAALVAVGAFQGADILRVHDVQFMARVSKMAAAVAAA